MDGLCSVLFGACCGLAYVLNRVYRDLRIARQQRDWNGQLVTRARQAMRDGLEAMQRMNAEMEANLEAVELRIHKPE